MREATDIQSFLNDGSSEMAMSRIIEFNESRIQNSLLKLLNSLDLNKARKIESFKLFELSDLIKITSNEYFTPTAILTELSKVELISLINLMKLNFATSVKFLK